MTTGAPRRPRRDDRGAAAVEMALVLPLLLLLVFGIIDFGRMLNAQITLTEAAREGARAAALGGDAHTQVLAATPQLTGVTETATVCPPRGSPPADVTVVTSYRFSFITPLSAIAPLFGGTIDGALTLTGKGVMLCGS